MKIAVPSIDGKTISEHFGRSSWFIVFETEDGKVRGREIRSNMFTPHALGQCSGDNGHHGGNHSHSAVVSALSDCKYLLCRGIGWRAVQDMKSKGIEPFILDRAYLPHEAVTLFLEGKLSSTGEGCRCHE
jgi:predicted Fe-Mo cluster-binding NifX family protein